MAIYSPVVPEACEAHDSQTEQWSNEGIISVNPRVTLHVPWALRHTLVADLLGNNRAWPFISGSGAPTAKRAAIRPIADKGVVTGQSYAYNLAAVDVEYATSDPTSTSGGSPPAGAVGEYYSEELEPTAQFQKLDPKKFRWGDSTGAAVAEDTGIGRIWREMNLVRTYYQVAFPLPFSIINLIGCVNEDAYSSFMLGLTFAPETLQYGCPHLSFSFKTDGTRTSTLVIRFHVTPNGWNKKFNPDTGIFQRLWSIENGALHYDHPLADMSALLW